MKIKINALAHNIKTEVGKQFHMHFKFAIGNLKAKGLKEEILVSHTGDKLVFNHDGFTATVSIVEIAEQIFNNKDKFKKKNQCAICEKALWKEKDKDVK